MVIPIVFGVKNFGRTDRFEYLDETYYRRSQRCHVWFIPIFPYGSLLVTERLPYMGYKIGECEPSAYACCRTALFHSPLCLFGWPSCLLGERYPEHCIPPVPKGDLLAYINFVRARKGLQPLASLPTADDSADESSSELFFSTELEKRAANEANSMPSAQEMQRDGSEGREGAGGAGGAMV